MTGRDNTLPAWGKWAMGIPPSPEPIMVTAHGADQVPSPRLEMTRPVPIWPETKAPALIVVTKQRASASFSKILENWLRPQQTGVGMKPSASVHMLGRTVDSQVLRRAFLMFKTV